MGSVAILATAAVPLLKRGRRALSARFRVQEAADHAALERAMASLKPQFAFVDVNLPQLGGMPGILALRRLHPDIAIVVLSNSPRENDVVSALKAGARGYCPTNIPPALLRKVARCIEHGEIWATRKVVSRALREMTFPARSRVDPGFAGAARVHRLSLRQRQVALLIAGGASNRQIAARLRVSEKTVKAYLTAIFRTLAVTNRVQLALFVAAHGGIGRSAGQPGRTAS
jgi:DNA-binding NarL/FixJ family response regulator